MCLTESNSTLQVISEFMYSFHRRLIARTSVNIFKQSKGRSDSTINTCLKTKPLKQVPNWVCTLYMKVKHINVLSSSAVSFNSRLANFTESSSLKRPILFVVHVTVYVIPKWDATSRNTESLSDKLRHIFSHWAILSMCSAKMIILRAFGQSFDLAMCERVERIKSFIWLRLLKGTSRIQCALNYTNLIKHSEPKCAFCHCYHTVYRIFIYE